MVGAIRLFIFGFIGLTAIYWLVSVYSRSVRRERLENDWAEDHPDDMESAERDAHIEDGMLEYQSGLRRKLILLVYIVPVVLVIAALIITNAN